jgi:hypothetical protein
MTANTTTWIRRVAAGAVLAAAPALIALGTATASYADSTSPSYSPTPSPQTSWTQSNWHHWHQSQVQSWYNTH